MGEQHGTGGSGSVPRPPVQRRSPQRRGQASGSPQAQTAPHYEAACSWALLEIKAMIYSAHPKGASLYRAGHKDPTASVLKESPLI